MELRPAHQRGVADHGWLQSRHTFSFGHYYDPEQIGFSDLRVINDDRVQAGGGFGTHGHQDMEIFSYVLDGALAHRDSMGNGSTIRPGDVQLMSAGTGVQHSEYNADPQRTVHFLQIWLLPNKAGLAPSYQQKHYPDELKRGRLQLLLSPDGADGSLVIRQDARIYAGLFAGDETATLDLKGLRHAYIHVARGSLTVNGQTLAEGDGVRIRNAQELHFSRGNEAEVLVFDLRPKELPNM